MTGRKSSAGKHSGRVKGGKARGRSMDAVRRAVSDRERQKEARHGQQENREKSSDA